MRIGILTFHYGNNYGGILQCYALQKSLENLGHDVEVLNVRPQTISLKERILNKIKQLTSFRELFENLFRVIRFKRNNDSTKGNLLLKVFDDFRLNYINLSRPLDEFSIGEYVNKTFDSIIVGSDQVWTSLYAHIPLYFIGWTPEFKGKRISYAACSAHSFVNENRKETLKLLLNKFDYISVRDNTTADLVESIINKRPDIVPDPTELYDFKEFIEKSKFEDEYILTYILGDEIKGGHLAALNKIKATTRVNKVYTVAIPGHGNEIFQYSDKIFYTLSPNEWVNMIHKSSVVYTDSFHAILFSMKFHKPFCAFYRNAIRSSRLIDLKKRFDIKNIVNSVEEIPSKLYIYESNKYYKDNLKTIF